MDIRHLRHFVAVAEELHFGRAARRLNMEQAPLSQSIKRFEEYLGGALFDRAARSGTQLTPLGQQLLPDARRLVSEFELTMQNAQLAATGEQRPVKVGFVTAGILQLVPQAIRRLHQVAPDIQVKLREAGTADLLDMLRDDELDVCITLPSEHCPPGIQMMEIRRDRTMLAICRHHALAEQKIITVDDIRKEPLIFFPRAVNPYLYKRLHDYFNAHDYTPSIEQEAKLTPTMLALVSAGLGVCFVQQSAALLPFPDVTLREIDDLSDAVPWSLMLAWKPRLANDGVMRFIDCLKAAAQDADNATPAAAP
ncbi:LysR family transcriptional regulator [Natronospirillum operosum]|uniref:LysR family transcriptional regulator n=1 Tax=Natronospirillum operosum TaxID=2759953 RepID=A0A4Z0WAN8_9GAMM|nr:LysR family transcriptional regulator [Natronospirillum operosum]TGG94259.1 LysR family transcriptional regulator [Natronospirillum operosum]